MNQPDCLTTALSLRVPVFEKDAGSATKIAGLEDYLLLSAYTVGEMHEERAHLELELKGLSRDWSQLVGWEPLARGKTDTAAEAAKAQLRPDLHDEMEDLRHWIKQLNREIDRLDNEAKKVSRAYTLITGS